MLGRNADGPRLVFVPKGRGSQYKKCNEHNLRNLLKMAKLQMLIKKETFQHLKWNVQINVTMNGNVYTWSVTLKSMLSYTKISFDLTHTFPWGWNFVFALLPRVHVTLCILPRAPATRLSEFWRNHPVVITRAELGRPAGWDLLALRTSPGPRGGGTRTEPPPVPTAPGSAPPTPLHTLGDGSARAFRLCLLGATFHSDPKPGTSV